MSLVERRFWDHSVRLDFDFDLGSLFELNFLPMRVGQTIRNPNLSIKRIGALDRDLSFFRFAGTGMSVNNPFDFSWEGSTPLFGRH